MFIDPYRWHTIKITSIMHQSPDAVSINTTRPSSYNFRAGQHCIIRIKTSDGVSYVRQYSYSGRADDKELSFTIVRSPDGVVSNWFINVATVGAIVELSQPLQGPLAVTEYNAPVGLIAGGSGIAAIISHTRALQDLGVPSTLRYLTHSDSLCYQDELQQYSKKSDYQIYETDKTSRPQPAELMVPYSNCSEIFICGSRPFVTAMKEYCNQYAPSATVHAEAFSL